MFRKLFLVTLLALVCSWLSVEPNRVRAKPAGDEDVIIYSAGYVFDENGDCIIGVYASGWGNKNGAYSMTASLFVNGGKDPWLLYSDYKNSTIPYLFPIKHGGEAQDVIFTTKLEPTHKVVLELLVNKQLPCMVLLRDEFQEKTVDSVQGFVR